MEEKKLTDEEIVKELINESNRGEWANLAFIDCVEVRVLKNALDLIRRLQDEKAEYERKLADGELVSKEWHDEQVGHAELVMEEQKEEIEQLTDKKLQEPLNQIFNARKNQYANMKLEKIELITIEEHKKQLVETCKDTAKEILTELLHVNFETKCTVSNYRKSKEDIEIVAKAILTAINEKIKEIAKRYGVEVG